MAKVQAQAAIVAMVMSGVFHVPGALAGEISAPTVVLHVRDFQGVPRDQLADAQRGAAKIYSNIGVLLVWRNGSARLDAVDHAVNADVVILDTDMADRHNRDRTAFGQASHATRRAYIYYSRIMAYSMLTPGNPDRALAIVLAHELGHVLLPEYSHTDTGIMRPSLWGPVFQLPRFGREQGVMIRTSVLRAGAEDEESAVELELDVECADWRR